MDQIFKFLDGRKTYLGAAVLAFATFAVSVGWIDQGTYLKVQGIVIAWLGASLRAAIGNGGTK